MSGSDGADDEPVASLAAKSGTLSVYADYVQIERSSRSLFEDKRIPLSAVVDVAYTEGILTGHVQLRQAGVDHDDAGLLTHPVDENTLHFPRQRREAAREVRDAILERTDGT